MKDITEAIFEVKLARDSKTGTVIAEHWLLNGKGHSPASNRPSTILSDPDGRPLTLIWKKEGVPHCDTGPAWIDFDPETGVHIRETYFKDGKCHRDGRQPARIERDPVSGEITQLRYFENGKERFWRSVPTVAP